jgi:phasin family protein
MTGTDQHRPGEKPAKRKQKRTRKAEQKKSELQTSKPIETVKPPRDAIAPQAQAGAVASTAAIETAPVAPVEHVASFRERLATVVPPPGTAPAKPAVPVGTAQTAPSSAMTPAAGFQAIANAYRDYTRKSFENAQSFAEKLSAARSLDKAVEAQTEFARQACEAFADNSRKIRELHRELFWQTFRLPGWPPGGTPR